ncbi:hypothetical protein IE81DRAFT_349218 [Ceraceosorus guamensis]|uniref:Secreted protein n=1 Tax=Ceraceosorus guamensis TaxID=1522189 RepID=A0A316VSX8_9BASI|nr:hypothetical protein IE81DRAFT_349218 [Ceraceosorus guamensis]PWN40480.1 hypothetical protein IE81DRAFT_349218 [Ceraceosorus guamensis]
MKKFSTFGLFPLLILASATLAIRVKWDRQPNSCKGPGVPANDDDAHSKWDKCCDKHVSNAIKQWENDGGQTATAYCFNSQQLDPEGYPISYGPICAKELCWVEI